jgi:predicted PurR-regulated permease PerM
MRAAQQRHLWFWLVALAAVLLSIALFKDILLPFVAGIVIAYFLNPLADRLEALGLGRTPSAGIVIGALGVLLMLGLVFVVPLLGEQVRQMLTALPTDIDKMKAALDAFAREKLGDHFPGVRQAIDRGLADLPQLFAGSAGTIAAALWSRGMALINIVSLLLITPLVAFYILVDWHRMLARVASWLPLDHAPTIRLLAERINEALSAFIRGQGAICLLLGVLYAAGLTLVGLNYGLVIGLLTGLMGFVPVVGWITGLLVAMVVALLQFGLATIPLLKVLAVFLAGQAIDTAWLSPRFVGQKVGLHPVWLIFSLFAFSYLFGLVGTLVAVPVAAAAAVVVRHGLKLYLESDYYHGQRDPGSSM